ncbi:molybdopterin dinucleotide binding domain-containing protein [Kribbella sp. NPDC054772]
MTDDAVNSGGDGPAADGEWSQQDYQHPSAGWGAAKSVASVLGREHAVLSGPRAMLKMNHEDGGFDCPGCAWPDAVDGLKLDHCENGVKHVVLRSCDLTVHVSTKLNRSHLVHGRQALILPCLGRTEIDVQAGGPQSVSVEESMSMVHLSTGHKRPASPHLLSEPAIIAGIAQATLPPSRTPWTWYVEDYDRIRDIMAKALDGFEDFNRRVRNRLGFRLRQPARELVFRTPSGRAEFSTADLPDVVPAEDDVLILQTMRSHDQWNTTIYSDNDRYRGVKNLRTLILMNPDDMRSRGLEQGALVDIIATARDGSVRELRQYRVLRYDLPRGNAAGYMPEMNVLVAANDYSTQSDQPLMKNIRVRVTPARDRPVG